MASFKEAFAAARKEKGAGSTFTWNGKSYSTNYKEEGYGNKKSSSSAPKTSPKPRAKPQKKSTPSKSSTMDTYLKGNASRTDTPKEKPVDAGANREPTQPSSKKVAPKPQGKTAKTMAAGKKSAEDRAAKDKAIIDKHRKVGSEKTFGEKLRYAFGMSSELRNERKRASEAARGSKSPAYSGYTKKKLLRSE